MSLMAYKTVQEFSVLGSSRLLFGILVFFDFFSFRGMPISRTWTFGAALLIWLRWSSLIVAAQDANTDPVEGDFP